MVADKLMQDLLNKVFSHWCTLVFLQSTLLHGNITAITAYALLGS